MAKTDEEKYIEVENEIQNIGLRNFLINLGVTEDVINLSEKSSPRKVDYENLTEIKKSSKTEGVVTLDANKIVAVYRTENYQDLYSYSWFELLDKLLTAETELKFIKGNFGLEKWKIIKLLVSLRDKGFEAFTSSFLKGSNNVFWSYLVREEGAEPHGIIASNEGNHRAILAKILGLKVDESAQNIRYFIEKG